MSSVLLHAPDLARSPPTASPLPGLLQTPSGLAILEIQGTIHLPDQGNGSEDEQIETGKLVFPYYDASHPAEDQSWMKRAYLYVGKHQRLTGEVKKLSKPVAVIRKRQKDGFSAEDDVEDLEIAEIIHYKVIFSQRPEPVGDSNEP